MTNASPSQTDLVIELPVAAPAHQLAAAVAHVEDWWSASIERSGDEFTVHFGANWTRIRVDGNRWTVTGQDTPAIPVRDEWIGDELTFDAIETGAASSRLRFTHHGLMAQECADMCQPAWKHFIESLISLAETGEGNPQRDA